MLNKSVTKLSAKKILIVAPYRTVAPHFETELEIAQRHLDQGDSVTFLSCTGALSNCDFNVAKDPSVCGDCRLRRGHGLQSLSRRVKSEDFPIGGGDIGTTVEGDLLTLGSQHFVNVESLKSAKVDNYDVGYAALSSLISQIRDPDFEPSEHVDALLDLSQSGLRVYRHLLQRFDIDRPDIVYVFNGRFAAMRAVLRACQAVGVDCLIHERACDSEHYQIWENQLPHDIEYTSKRMQTHWAQASDDEIKRADKASAWYEGRVKGVETNWFSFVKDQDKGRLPDDWDPNEHNIAVFTTSEDEFVAIGDCWDNPLYPDQGEAIEKIAAALAEKNPDAKITVRMHPNLKGVDNRRIRRMREFALPNIRVIPPEVQVDSYHLMHSADTVVTFGSTMGIEAVYWGKPSVSLGQCFYQNLKGTYRPASHEEALELLAKKLQPIKDHEALIYGFWNCSHGIKYKYFEPADLFTGRFKGQEIYPKQPKTIKRSLLRKVESIRKRLRPHKNRHAA